MSTTAASTQIFMAIDTSNRELAEKLVRMAKKAGASTVKFGLELATATSWEACALLAKQHGLQWVADAKLCDIPNTVGASASNISSPGLVPLAHPPIGITVHASAGVAAMRAAKDAVGGDIKVLGVTMLTSLSDLDCYRIFGPPSQERVTDKELAQTAAGYRSKKVLQLARDAARANLDGIVCSAHELAMLMADPLTSHLFKMVPGIRPDDAATGDQSAVATPRAAVLAGADALVIGRPIYGAPDPAQAFANITAEIQGALDVKA